MLLRVEDLHKRYGKEEVLKGVSFTLEKGETKVIIGPSGTGKSTLLRCINRLTEPDRGRIWLEDVEITSPKVNINRIRPRSGSVRRFMQRRSVDFPVPEGPMMTLVSPFSRVKETPLRTSSFP